MSCAAILAFVAVRGVGRFGTWRLYGVAFPLELAGLMGLLLASSAGAVAASLFTNAGFALFSLFLDTVLYTISFRYGVNALVLFGWARFAASAGSVAGRIADGAFRMLEGDGRAYAACAVMLLLTLCFVLLTNRGHIEEVAWGVGNQRPAAGPSGTPAQGAPAVRMGLAETVAVISRERGLTRREEQVLELLAQNRTAVEIEAELLRIERDGEDPYAHGLPQAGSPQQARGRRLCEAAGRAGIKSLFCAGRSRSDGFCHPRSTASHPFLIRDRCRFRGHYRELSPLWGRCAHGSFVPQ